MVLKARDNFHARVSEDRLRITVTGSFPVARANDEVSRVRNELVELGMKVGPEMDAAERLLRTAIRERQTAGTSDTISLEDVLIFEGTPPTPSVDAYVEWGGDFMKEGFVVDLQTDTVDYRRHAANPSVVDGQLLARIVPAMIGDPGVDVFGNRIEPRKPKGLVLRAGKNVRCTPDASEFYAEKAGRVRFVKNTVSVDDVFQIDGSVGLRTGHIDHPGAIIVSQDVEADSELIAAGDIEIRGSVEEANVRSGGSIVVRGGIVGRSSCRIVAEGNVEASFLRQCTVETGGNVTVTQEIDQCLIRARGAVVVRGRVVGGEIVAVQGMDIAQIGSDAGMRTTLSVGKDWVLEAQIAEQQASIDAATENLKKVAAAIAPLQHRLLQLQGEARTRAIQLVQRAKAMREAVDKAKSDIEVLHAQLRESWRRPIIIRKSLFPDALLTIGPQHIKVESVVHGPRKLEMRDNRLRFRELADGETL